ncbi:SAV_2336 N-terminal domain-related protein [Streptomyces sp. NPDC101150]|uniref:SAV_2336 N-terminal domain-related protein n=1 Tax=Streptomyces sp. NPDC101150 TaxID=3366114 RepID=UPI0037FBDC3D
MIDRLRQAMSATGYDLGATELLDVLWLARVMEGRTAPRAAEPGEGAAGADLAGTDRDGGAAPRADAAGGSPEPAGEPPDAAGDGPEPAGPGESARPSSIEPSSVGPPSAGPVDPAAPDDVAEPVTPDGPSRRALYAMGSQGGEPGADRARPARVPGGRALPDAQQLGRALRPLRRSRDHPHRTVTDIEATVRLAAETGFLDVVSRPDQERRWSAVLLVDCSPSLQVWGPLAAELRALLARSTVFRSVEVHVIDPQDPAASLVSRRAAARASMTFVLTDGTSPGWRSPQAVRALTAWGRGGPVAVLNPLPRRLWRGTALDARPRLLAAPGEFDPVGRLIVCDALSGERDPDADGLLALPVLHPTASALEQWAGLVTRPGVPHLIETALLDEAPLPAPPPRPHGTAEELLTHFRGAFSPEAYRLAVRLSAIRPLTTPLMQLVRAATMRDAGPTHVAEILLGGLLERTDRARDAAAARTLDRALGPTPPGQVVQPVYDFRPGVRELLFSGLGTEAAVEVVEAVGRSLEPYMGRLPDFPVLMGDDEGELRLHASARAFAVLASPVLERMGGAVPEDRNGVVPQQRRPVASPPLRFGVLGPVRAWRGETPVPLGGPEEQALLASLLLRPGRSATASELAAGIWRDRSPRDAAGALRACAARLRAALGEDLLVRERPDGYGLRRPGGGASDDELDLDLDRAARLIARARNAEDPAEARQLRDSALALWAGEPLAGLPGPFAETHRTRLERWRGDLLDGLYRPPAQDGSAPPAAPAHFFGRTEEIAELVAGLTRPDGPTPCWALHGPAGAGKTALAGRVAQEVADRFPDGQLWVDPRGAGPDGIAHYRALLAERRVLLVLDDVVPDDDADGAADDVPGGASGDASAADETLAALLPDPTAVRGGAVLITGRRRPRLAALTGTVRLTRPTAAEAHRALPEHLLLQWFDAQLTPLAHRAFCLLAVPESAALSLPAAAALLDTTADRARAPLAELRAIGALERTATRHYRYAGELRSFARGIADSELPTARRDEVLSGLLTCYLAMGRRLYQGRYPGERWLGDLTRVPSSAGAWAKGPGPSLAAWADETPHVLALVRQVAVRAPRHLRPAADLLLLTQVTADCGAPSAAFETAARTVAERAATEGDGRAEGRARVALAEAGIARGRFDDAERAARRAEDLARRSDDPVTSFRAPYARGIIALHQRRPDTAERCLTAAWEHSRDRNDQVGEATALAALARLWAAVGNGTDAVLFAERSVGILRRAGDTAPRLALGLYALAEALSAAGRHTDALRALVEALPLFEEDRQHLWAGRTRCRTAAATAGLIRPGEAVSAAQDAAKRLLVPGGERWRADALAVLGHAETALGRTQDAQAHWREALAVYEEFGAPEAEDMRALLPDGAGLPTAGAGRPSVSRTAYTAATGTFLRDLAAAVGALRDRLRLEAAGHGAASTLGTLASVEDLEAELIAQVDDFAPGRRPSAEDRKRLSASVETVASHPDFEALAGVTPDVRERADALRRLGRRLAP